MRVPPGIWRGPRAKQAASSDPHGSLGAARRVHSGTGVCFSLSGFGGASTCDCPHAHGDLQASQSAVDVRGTIGAARHLILPGCCLIEMSARHRPLAPPVCLAIPRPLARAGDSKDNGHQVKNVTSPAACGQRCLSRRRKGVGGVSARASHPVTGA